MEKGNDYRNRHIPWIDGAKFTAIMAVIIDHTTGVVHNNSHIRLVSFFSVSLFILISGITAWESIDKASGIKEGYFNSIKKILSAYLLATFIYQAANHKFFDFETYLYYLIHFNASSPFYYVFLYMQIMLFKQLFNRILSGGGYKQKNYNEAIFLLIVVLISYFTMNYTNIFDIYGGGRLFGGTYLILFYLGMLIAKHRWLDETIRVRKFSAIVIFGGLWIFWIGRLCSNISSVEAFILAGNAINPPGIVIMVSACLILPFTFGIFSLLDEVKICPINQVVKGMFLIGRHSLYVFLYHRLILDCILIPYIDINSIWLKRIVYVFSMILGSLFIEIIVKKISSILKKLYNSK